MSSTSVKNILLSQPRIGQNEVSIAVLAHTVKNNDGETTVEIEVPGVDPSTIGVNCEGNTLTVTCARGQLSVPIDPTVDTSKISADILWGLLTLTIPAPAVPAPQSIKINVIGQTSHAKKPTATSRFTEKD